MMALLQESLEALDVKCKLEPLPEATTARTNGVMKLLIGGFDRREQKFKGWVGVENSTCSGVTGSLCVAGRDEVGLAFTFASFYA
jgi:hypothetical protein